MYPCTSGRIEAPMQFHESDFELIRETWLEKSVEAINIAGHKIVARRDRHIGANRDGVLLLCKCHINTIVHVQATSVFERLWHIIRTDFGSLVLCNWYRSDCLIHGNFTNLHSELQCHIKDIYIVFMAGDIIVHHKK